jgi:hypothetical protein
MALKRSYPNGLELRFIYGGTGILQIGGIIGGINDAFDTNYTWNDNQWYYVAFTRDGVGNWSLYVNGAAISHGTGFTNSVGTSTNWQIGVMRGGGSNWFGSIDDVRIYNRALSAAEISAMYNGGK